MRIRDLQDDDEVSSQEEICAAGQVATIHIGHFCRKVQEEGIVSIPNIFEVLRGLDICAKV